MIQFENVTKQYPDGTYAVRDLNLNIERGELFVLIGPSGCGKTTTLKMINRLIDLTEGYVRINGRPISEYDIHELRWSIGYVLQQIALFPHMSIAENIAIVPELKKWKEQRIREKVDELLNMVGLEASKYRNRKPKELSGGQQQRIGVLRALAADPEIVLMDEPFSALDPISRERLQDDILDLQRKLKKTVVFVTHDIQEALKLGDRICVMKEGQILQVGTPEDLLQHPVDEFVREFVGVQKSSVVNQDMNLKSLIQPIPEGVEYSGAVTISASASNNEILDALALEDQLPVEKEGRIIGILSRQAVIQDLSSRLKGSGERNE